MIKRLSPAKINLTLDVFEKKTGTRFHEIKTIYHKLNWGDTITLEPAENFALEGNFDCPLEKNLIYKAWRLLNRDRSQSSFLNTETGLKILPAVKVSVNKIIPTGAGLGGGSSNAATFIQGYHDLFNLGPLSKALKAKLAALGKDIPFFLQDDPCALGTHYGEEITPLPFNFSNTPVYLFTPKQKQPTAEAYQRLEKFNTNYTKQFLQTPNLNLCNNIFNSQIDHKFYTKNRLESINLCGSGSSFFSFEAQDIGPVKAINTTLL